MLATLDVIRSTYGSVERYVIDQCRLSPEAVDQIRKNFITEANAEDQLPVDWEAHAAMVVADDAV